MSGAQEAIASEGSDTSALAAETPISEAFESKRPAEEPQTTVPFDGQDLVLVESNRAVSEVPTIVSAESFPGGQAAAKQAKKRNGGETASDGGQAPSAIDIDASIQVPSTGQQQPAADNDDDGESSGATAKTDTIAARVSGPGSDQSDSEKDSPEVRKQGSEPSSLISHTVGGGKTASPGGQPNELDEAAVSETNEKKVLQGASASSGGGGDDDIIVGSRRHIGGEGSVATAADSAEPTGATTVLTSAEESTDASRLAVVGSERQTETSCAVGANGGGVHGSSFASAPLSTAVSSSVGSGQIDEPISTLTLTPPDTQEKHTENIIIAPEGTEMPAVAIRGNTTRVEVGGPTVVLAGPVSVLSAAEAATAHARSPLLGSNARFSSAPSSRGDMTTVAVVDLWNGGTTTR